LLGGGEAEGAEYLAGGVQLRVYGHGQTEIVAHEFELVEILGVPHARDRVARAEPAGYHAAEDVHFVGSGGGDHEGAFRDAGVVERVTARAAAADGHNVVGGAQVLKSALVGVDSNDFVSVKYELFHKGAPNLANAGYYNIHCLKTAPFDMSTLISVIFALFDL